MGFSMARNNQPLSQRNDALVIANRIRLNRAQVKRDLKTGKVSIVNLLEDPPESIYTMPVWELIKAIPYVGVSRISRMTKSCTVSQRRTIGNLTDREHAELLETLLRYLPPSVRN